MSDDRPMLDGRRVRNGPVVLAIVAMSMWLVACVSFGLFLALKLK